MEENSGKKPDNGQMMGRRGVTRPMAGMKMKKGHEQSQKKMDQKQRMKMMKMHHKETLWIYWSILLLGFWMISFPFTFGYDQGVVQPSGGREIWLSLEQRIMVMKWSDVVSGILLVIFGWRALKPNRPVSLWICCFIGVWLSMAPLIFWSPTAVGYLNATLVGTLVIALSILIPGMPNMMAYMKMGSEVPPGWSYNPSSWPQRWIMIVLGFIGWIVSRYLAAFQLGYIDVAWDPFFGNGSMQVLNSKMSHSLPISDGALGAMAYTLEFLMGWMGSSSRWRTMPWMVALFGILVIPLGLVHIFLVISQPLIVGAWCTFCLLAAIIMLPMIPLEVDEVIAMGQHMVKAKKRGDNMWQVFWKGGKPFAHNKDERSPELMNLPEEPGAVIKASTWGMSVPWSLAISTFLGIAAMFLPSAFGLEIQETAADIFHLFGALVVVTSVISMGEVVRKGRYFNLLLGSVLAAAPWFVAAPTGLRITGLILGILVLFLCLPLGPVKERYGSWNAYIK